MSFVSEYNLGRDASTTSFLAALVHCVWDTVLRCLLTLRDRPERKPAVRIVGMDTGCAMACLPIMVFFRFYMCQAPMAKPLALSQHSCHGIRFMLLFAHAYAIHLTARMKYSREM
jgi:hypothetical protein